MSENRKYFYLKLKDNFFDREEIKVIKGMQKGDTYVCIMLELYLKSLKRGGELMFRDRIPYALNTLSSVLGRNEDEVKFAIELFESYGLIERLETGSIFMSDIQNFIGESSTEGDRKRAFRKQIECSKNLIGHLSDIRPPELELELELETELELDFFACEEKNKKNISAFDFYSQCWNEFFGTTPIANATFKRECEFKLKGLTRKQVKSTLEKYSSALSNPDSWIELRVDAFEFLTKKEYGFIWFLNVEPDRLLKKTKPQKEKKKSTLESLKEAGYA